MKLSVSMWSVVQTVREGKMDLHSFIDFAAQQGAEGVELLDYFWTDKQAQIPLVKQQIAQAGLALAVYSIGNDFFQPDAAARDREFAALKQGVDIANQLEVKVMRVFSGNAKTG